MRRTLNSFLFCFVAITGFSQVPPPVKPSSFQGVKRLNEVDNKNGILSNSIYPDQALTKEYKRYQTDSLGYIKDSLQYVKLQQIAPVKPSDKRKN